MPSHDAPRPRPTQRGSAGDRKVVLARHLAVAEAERLGIRPSKDDVLRVTVWWQGEFGLQDPTRFRAWLDDYAQRCHEAAAIMRVWTDALTRDPELGTDSARVIRVGCRGIVELLRHRGSGDVEPEAMVMMVFLEEMTSGRPSQKRTDGIGHTIERSLLFLG